MRKGEGNLVSFGYCLVYSRFIERIICCFVFIFIIGFVELYFTCFILRDFYSKF